MTEYLCNIYIYAVRFPLGNYYPLWSNSLCKCIYVDEVRENERTDAQEVLAISYIDLTNVSGYPKSKFMRRVWQQHFCGLVLIWAANERFIKNLVSNLKKSYVVSEG